MTEREWEIYLADILDSIKKIERYTKRKRLNTFLQNDMAKDAVIRNLEIIGEASK